MKYLRRKLTRTCQSFRKYKEPFTQAIIPIISLVTLTLNIIIKNRYKINKIHNNKFTMCIKISNSTQFSQTRHSTLNEIHSQPNSITFTVRDMNNLKLINSIALVVCNQVKTLKIWKIAQRFINVLKKQRWCHYSCLYQALLEVLKYPR